MPRAYTVATAALALRVPNKWLDNTLSHYVIKGVSQARQGVSRRLPVDSLSILNIALVLIADLDLPLGRALTLGAELQRSAGKVILPSGTSLQLDLEQLTAVLLSRLELAVEVAPLPRRGRPPQKTTGRLD